MESGGGEVNALDDGGGGDVNVFAAGEMMPVVLGVGEMELKPTRSLRLAPWEPDTGLGAAIEVFVVVGLAGSDSPGIDGLLVVD